MFILILKDLQSYKKYPYLCLINKSILHKMKKLFNSLFILLLLNVGVCAYADEGMWLLQIMQEQHSIDMMKKQGLRLNATDIYNPNGVSLKDAVGIFGGGCTGEIISPNGLILTNHHCGYESIQEHSSVEHDYLTNGFWAKSLSEELPTPGLQFRFVDKIIDVTDIVNADIKAKKITEAESLSRIYCSKLAKKMKDESEYKDKSYIEAEILPYYAGNCFYLIYYKIYSDVRMVAAPPSAIGKFGGETDNWMWPRHTGDFSMFRIYADKNGEPANYSKDNVPLKVKKYLTVSLKGVNEGDYAMVMGFPGRTYRYLTVSEVKSRMYSQNEPRIKVREARQNVLSKAMAASDKTRIQYASKFAMSSNYWKNSIGMNKAIIDNDVMGTKAKQEKTFEDFAKDKPEYQGVVAGIDSIVTKSMKKEYNATAFSETFLGGIEFTSVAGATMRMDQLKKDITAKNDTAIQKDLKIMQEVYNGIHNKDYDHEVDRNVAKALIPLYADMVSASERPSFYDVIATKYKGNYNKFIDEMYSNSIFANEENFKAFMKKPTIKAIDKDVALLYANSILDYYKSNFRQSNTDATKLSLLHKKYIRGLNEMKLPTPSYPDANFTMRLTYGNVKSYNPKDGVVYRYYTTTDGVLQKEDEKNPEFVVPAKLKELIQKKDFGRYAMPDGEMPVCFLTTNDITGGNSGSPVLNADGQLIGAAFDGNWESLSGDISFDNNLQRCIVVDIRYVLFILDKLGGCSRLINEMAIAQ
jgi:hypothetical protein